MAVDAGAAQAERVTTTQFGYTGDGDRLWEITAGVTMIFTLDLNTALTQILAQHSGGTTTRLRPGIGQQNCLK
jgi:hypothetical protein